MFWTAGNSHLGSGRPGSVWCWPVRLIGFGLSAALMLVGLVSLPVRAAESVGVGGESSAMGPVETDSGETGPVVDADDTGERSDSVSALVTARLQGSEVMATR